MGKITPLNGKYLTSKDNEQFQNYYSDITSFMPANPKALLSNDLMATKTVTFVVTEKCNLDCTYCLSGDTKILMEDFSSKDIKDVIVGDKVLAFNELSENKNTQNKLRIATVEQLHHRTAETIIITFDNNESITITPNHKLLARRNTSGNSDYKEAGKFKVGQYVYTSQNQNDNIIDCTNDINYKIGYVLGMMQGDGSYKHYIDKNGYDMYKVRLAVKDDEIITRTSKYMSDLGIEYYISDFEVSKKHKEIKPAIFANKRESYEKLINIESENFNRNNSIEYYKGYLAAMFDAEGNHYKKSNTIRIFNSDLAYIREIETALKAINVRYTVESKAKTINNKDMYVIRILNTEKQYNQSLKFIKEIFPAVKRKGIENFYEKSLFYRKKITKIEKGNSIEVYNIGTTERTYIANNILVHNCYEIHKTGRRMSIEVARSAIDFLFDREKVNGYFDHDISTAIILDFIGGEPLLEIDLIDNIVDYFHVKCLEYDSPWLFNYMISISTNGVLYNSEKVQNFLEKNKGKVSIGISIDGNKELHDACRVFPDGSGSYDIVEKAIKSWLEYSPEGSTKITLSPYNVSYLPGAIKNIWDLGLNFAFSNCIYEEGWEPKHATILYNKMKELADYMLENNLYYDHYLSLFEETLGQGEVDLDKNWCFKPGTLIFTPDGNKRIEDLKIGDSVISKDKSIQKIENILTRVSENTATIRAAGMFKTNTTSEHPYLVKRFSHIENKNVYKYKDPEWVQVKDIKKGDKIALFGHKFGDINFNKDLAYIVGRYIGDGWNSTTGYKICCSHEELKELETYMNKANINYSIDKYRTVYQFNIFKNNEELINILSQIGKGASEKNIPKEAFDWTKESMESLLNGLYDADGCYSEKKNMKTLNTVSSVLANELLIILRGFGYLPTCHKNKRAGKSFIEGREVEIKDRYEIYFNLNKDSSRFIKYDESMDVYWSTVRGIELDCEPYEVFNLTVENTHNFIANGAIVHNCGGNGQMLAIGPDGKCFPCLRFMKHSLSKQKEQCIGDVYNGIVMNTPFMKELKAVTLRTQSDEKCLNCTIGQGCSLCTGYNYDEYGTPNKRATHICIMHQARFLANVYYWNKLIQKEDLAIKFENNINEEWALKIIDKDEWDMLNSLCNQ